METRIKSLNPRHYKMVDFFLRGWTNKQVAEHFGMSEGQVSVILHSSTTQLELARRREKMESLSNDDIVEQTIKVDEAIKSHTLAAVGRLGLIIESGKDPDAIRAADSILDRGGHARVQRTESKSVEVRIDGKDAALIAETLDMDRQATPSEHSAA
jgi:hypothetical protein